MKILKNDNIKTITDGSVDEIKLTYSYKPNKLLSKTYVNQHISKELHRNVPICINDSFLRSYLTKYNGRTKHTDFQEVIGILENNRIKARLEKKLSKMKTDYFNIVNEIFTNDSYFKNLRDSLKEDEYLDFYIFIKGYNFKSFISSINPKKLNINIKSFRTDKIKNPGFRFYIGKNDIKDEGRKLFIYID